MEGFGHVAECRPPSSALTTIVRGVSPGSPGSDDVMAHAANSSSEGWSTILEIVSGSKQSVRGSRDSFKWMSRNADGGIQRDDHASAWPGMAALAGAKTPPRHPGEAVTIAAVQSMLMPGPWLGLQVGDAQLSGDLLFVVGGLGAKRGVILLWPIGAGSVRDGSPRSAVDN